MKRLAFVWKLKNPANEYLFDEMPEATLEKVNALLDEAGLTNFSAWKIAEFVFCYGESADDEANIDTMIDKAAELLSDYVKLLAKPSQMRLMYHDIGTVREDKSLIRHRVFATHIKPGCAEEYKARHDNLIAQRGGDSNGAETNFTIWCAFGEYNFGYCELVKSYDHPLTEKEKASTIAWETKMLEIMDWYTDDVDWITGEKHPHVRKLYQYK